MRTVPFQEVSPSLGLSCEELNRAYAVVEQFSQFIGQNIQAGAGGVTLRQPDEDGFWAKITDSDPAYTPERFYFKRQAIREDGTVVDDTSVGEDVEKVLSDRVNEVYAIEVNGFQTAVGTVVWMRQTHPVIYSFDGKSGLTIYGVVTIGGVPTTTKFTNVGSITVKQTSGLKVVGVGVGGGIELGLWPATTTDIGGIDTNAQTFAGDKTFNGNMTFVAQLYIGNFNAGGTGGALVFNGYVGSPGSGSAAIKMYASSGTEVTLDAGTGNTAVLNCARFEAGSVYMQSGFGVGSDAGITGTISGDQQLTVEGGIITGFGAGSGLSIDGGTW
jgi:hypothetical protein